METKEIASRHVKKPCSNFAQVFSIQTDGYYGWRKYLNYVEKAMPRNRSEAEGGIYTRGIM